jgi:hypothetical protein
MTVTLHPATPCASAECAEASGREMLAQAWAGIITPPPVDDDPTQTEPEQTMPYDIDLCPVCGGSGEVFTVMDSFGVLDTETCRWCSGTGEVYVR